MFKLDFDKKNSFNYGEVEKYLHYKVFEIFDDSNIIGSLEIIVANAGAYLRDFGYVDALLDDHDSNLYDAIDISTCEDYDNVVVINSFQIFEKFRHQGYGRNVLKFIENFIKKYYTRCGRSCCICAQVEPKYYVNVERQVAKERLLNFYLSNGYIKIVERDSPLIFKSFLKEGR